MPATYWTLERLGMLDEDAGEPLPQEVQRPVLQQDGRPPRRSTSRDRPARELADLAGAAQRVRRDAARQRRRARASRCGAALSVARGPLRRRAGGRRPRCRTATARRGEIAAASWSTPPAGARSSPGSSACIGVEPSCGKPPSSPTSRARCATPASTRAPRSSSTPRTRQVLVLVHPAARRPGERRRGGLGRLPDQRPRPATRSRSSTRRWRSAPAAAAAHRRRRARLFPIQAPPRLLLPLLAHRRRRLGAGGRRLRLPRPDLLDRACCWP